MKPHKSITFLVVLFLAACGTIEVGIERVPTSAESATVNARATDEAYQNARSIANLSPTNSSSLSIETPVEKGTPSLPTSVSGSTDIGELYFSIKAPDQTSAQLLKVSGSCVLELSPCAAPEIVGGYPTAYDGTDIQPLSWSALGDMAAMETNKPENLVLFTPALNNWRILNQFSTMQGGLSPAWSEDGKWIAVIGRARNEFPYTGILVISPETGEKKDISAAFLGLQSRGAWFDSLSWFSGQVLVAFHNGSAESAPDGLWLFPLNGDSPVQMAAFNQPFGSYSLSPSGKAIAVIQYDQDPMISQSPNRSRLVLTNIDGSHPITLTEFQDTDVKRFYWSNLQWSWNGKWILFTINNNITYAIQPDGSNLHEIFHLAETNYTIIPTPDDDTVLVRTDSKIHRVSVTTGNDVLLQIPGIDSNMNWLDAFWRPLAR